MLYKDKSGNPAPHYSFNVFSNTPANNYVMHQYVFTSHLHSLFQPLTVSSSGNFVHLTHIPILKKKFPYGLSGLCAAVCRSIGFESVTSSNRFFLNRFTGCLLNNCSPILVQV
jgi:hypothetical protein